MSRRPARRRGTAVPATDPGDVQPSESRRGAQRAREAAPRLYVYGRGPRPLQWRPFRRASRVTHDARPRTVLEVAGTAVTAPWTSWGWDPALESAGHRGRPGVGSRRVVAEGGVMVSIDCGRVTGHRVDHPTVGPQGPHRASAFAGPGVAYSLVVASPTPEPPNLMFAVLCERALQEKDNTLSLVRIVDSVRVTPPRGSTGTPGPAAVNLQLALGFRAEGPASGELKLRWAAPDGNHQVGAPIPLNMKGGGEGANVIVPLTISGLMPGRYWIEVEFASQLLARVPLRVRS